MEIYGGLVELYEPALDEVVTDLSPREIRELSGKVRHEPRFPQE